MTKYSTKLLLGLVVCVSVGACDNGDDDGDAADTTGGMVTPDTGNIPPPPMDTDTDTGGNNDDTSTGAGDDTDTDTGDDDDNNDSDTDTDSEGGDPDTDTGDDDDEPPPEDVEFEDVEPIFAICAGCHDGATIGGTAFDTLSPDSWDATPAGQNTAFLLVDKNNPADSYILLKISDAPPEGQQMPLGGELDPDDIDLIQAWIEGGAQGI